MKASNILAGILFVRVNVRCRVYNLWVWKWWVNGWMAGWLTNCLLRNWDNSFIKVYTVCRLKTHTHAHIQMIKMRVLHVQGNPNASPTFWGMYVTRWMRNMSTTIPTTTKTIAAGLIKKFPVYWLLLTELIALQKYMFWSVRLLFFECSC